MHSTGFHHTHCAARAPLQLFLSVSFHDASQDAHNHRIRRVDIATGATTTLAGSGSSAWFYFPTGVAIDPSGTFALVAVRRPPPHPRVAPSRKRHTRLARGVGAAPVFSAARPPVHELFLSVSVCVVT